MAEHHVVYRQKGRFAAWPANYGAWIWDSEVLAVFAAGSKGSQGKLHARDKNRPFPPLQARSLDGGCTWTIEAFDALIPGGESLSADEHLSPRLKARTHFQGLALPPPPSPVNFLDPETIVMAARTGLGGDAISWFYVSRNRGKRWEGPYAFSGLMNEGIAARTDIVALSAERALFMLTRAKADGTEGETCCAQTCDGARSFRVIGTPVGNPDGYAIMPASAMLADGSILTVLRCGRSVDDPGWLEAYRSPDGGHTWHRTGTVVDSTGRGGNPPSLTISADGRLFLVYGVRARPFGVRLKTSADGGETWSAEQIIRSDGHLPDLGYVRSMLRSDGKLVCVYYFNEAGERYIAASIVDTNGLV
ncbi:hypothetical protein FHX08_006300 [Rhizobium sp. BK529]|uniref:sialidase family protein n=1 Tax=Rhizobium sp. BK529 TaxID=2586983 RepID=UPI001815B9E7|nr:sialidase family protein [Rhizobium sp. BK529]MBB3595880.1 hypothetical protein [Rhizobium sp. BK529]